MAPRRGQSNCDQLRELNVVVYHSRGSKGSLNNDAIRIYSPLLNFARFLEPLVHIRMNVAKLKFEVNQSSSIFCFLIYLITFELHPNLFRRKPGMA